MIRRVAARLPNSCSFGSTHALIVAEPSVEALHEPVLLRLAGRDVVRQHASLLLPAQDRMRHELGAVVADDHCRATEEFGDAVQFASHP